MPTYEYRCPNGHLFEKYFPRMNDRRHMRCPTCGKRAERVISGGAGLVFKGSGFYATDYKRPGEQEPKQTGEGDSKASEKTKSKASEPTKKTDSGDK